MTPLPELSELGLRRREIQDQLAGLGDLRPGSLTPRFRKCGKPTCHCAAQGDPGHGPSWSLTWAVEGKTRTRIIPAEAVDPGADCRVSARPGSHPRTVRGQHPDVRCATRCHQGDPKKDFVAALEPEVRHEIATEAASLIGVGVLDDFQAIETEARRVALQIMGQAVAAKLNADHSDYQGPCLPCACGGEARFAGRRPKTFTTALDAMTLERAWYHCDGCHSGFSPRDRALGMEDTFLSPAALRMIGIAAARTSFEGSSALLRELAGLTVAPKTVERHAEALGREIAGDEYRVIEPEPGDAPTLYLGLDGTGVPARKTEVVGREGKQLDGSAKTREKNRKGHYYFMNIDAPPEAIDAMERTMRINEDVIRYLTVRVDEHDPNPAPLTQSRGRGRDGRGGRGGRWEGRRRDDDGEGRRREGEGERGERPERQQAVPAAAADAKAIDAMERTMRINEDVIRYLTVRVDEHDPNPAPLTQSRGRGRDGRGGRGGRWEGRRRDDDGEGRRREGEGERGERPERQQAVPAAAADAKEAASEPPVSDAPSSGESAADSGAEEKSDG